VSPKIFTHAEPAGGAVGVVAIGVWLAGVSGGVSTIGADGGLTAWGVVGGGVVGEVGDPPHQAVTAAHPTTSANPSNRSGRGDMQSLLWVIGNQG
jgi:hypothetical protein